MARQTDYRKGQSLGLKSCKIPKDNDNLSAGCQELLTKDSIKKWKHLPNTPKEDK